MANAGLTLTSPRLSGMSTTVPSAGNYSLTVPQYVPPAADTSIEEVGRGLLSLGTIATQREEPLGSSVKFDAAQNKISVGGIAFDADDYAQAVETESLIGQPTPYPTEGSWVDLDEGSWREYVSGIKNPSTAERAKRNWDVGVANYLGTLGSLAQFVGAEEYGANLVLEQERVKQKLAPFVQEFTTARNPEDVGAAIIGTLAQQGPNALDAILFAAGGALAGGAVGGPATALGGAVASLTGRQAIKKAMIEAAEKYVAKQPLNKKDLVALRAAKQLPQIVGISGGKATGPTAQAILQAAKVQQKQFAVEGGALAGLTLGNFKQALGETYGEFREQGAGPEDMGARAKALLTAVPFAALDVAGDVVTGGLAKGIGGLGRKTAFAELSGMGKVKEVGKRAGVGLAIGAPVGGITEVGQEALLLGSTGQDFSDPKNVTRLMESFLAGAAGQGVVDSIANTIGPVDVMKREALPNPNRVETGAATQPPTPPAPSTPPAQPTPPVTPGGPIPYGSLPPPVAPTPTPAPEVAPAPEAAPPMEALTVQSDTPVKGSKGNTRTITVSNGSTYTIKRGRTGWVLVEEDGNEFDIGTKVKTEAIAKVIELETERQRTRPPVPPAPTGPEALSTVVSDEPVEGQGLTRRKITMSNGVVVTIEKSKGGWNVLDADGNPGEFLGTKKEEALATLGQLAVGGRTAAAVDLPREMERVNATISALDSQLAAIDAGRVTATPEERQALVAQKTQAETLRGYMQRGVVETVGTKRPDAPTEEQLYGEAARAIISEISKSDAKSLANTLLISEETAAALIKRLVDNKILVGLKGKYKVNPKLSKDTIASIFEGFSRRFMSAMDESSIKLAIAVQNDNFAGILDALSESDNPAIRDIAKRARYLEGKIKFNVVPDNPEFLGRYIVSGRRIGDIDIAVSSVASVHTVAHEIVHAMTAQQTHQKKNSAPVKRLKELFEYVKGLAAFERQYGLDTVDEFLAEAMSNPEFQFQLNQIRYKGTSLWSRFARTVADILGIKYNTAFTEVLTVYTEISTQQEMDIQNLLVKQRGRNRGIADVAIQQRAQPKLGTVAARVAEVAGISNARQIAASQQWRTNRDFKLAMQDAVLAAAGSRDLTEDTPQNRRYITDILLKEARDAMVTNANAIGWYDDKVTTALEVLYTIHPELQTNEQAKFAFIWALAVTSNGVKVDKNFELAERAYTYWKNNKEFPTSGIGVGTAAKSIHNGLRTYNELIQDWGYDKLKAFATTLQPNRQVKKIYGRPVSGEGQGTLVYGAGVLGPKIGNGFFMNLYGEFGQLTMDRWWVRMWGRMTGELVDTDRKKIRAARDAFVSMIDLIKSDREATRAVESVLGVKLNKTQPVQTTAAIVKATSEADVRNALKAILPATPERLQEVIRARGDIDKSKFTSVADELRKAAKTFAGRLDGQIEVPGAASRRDMMRDISKVVLAELQKEQPALTMADFQAMMWYPEKTLYDTAGAEQQTTEGYTDEEAPDYANAAIALARRQGVPDGDIRRAVERARESISARRRAERSGRGLGRLPDEAGYGARETAVVNRDTTLQLKGPRRGIQKLKKGTIDVDGVQRSTTNSSGQPIHPTQEGIRNFWRWFGDSKVVDEQGRPLVVYHGTPADFKAFKEGTSWEGFGFHFGTAEAANQVLQQDRHGGGRPQIMPVYLSIKNQLKFDASYDRGRHDPMNIYQMVMRKAEEDGVPGITEDDIDAYYQDEHSFNGTNFLDVEGVELRNLLRKWLGSMGYDGIEYVNAGEDAGSTSWIAFTPTQVKSAVGNVGTFSPEKENVLQLRGPRRGIQKLKKGTQQKSFEVYPAGRRRLAKNRQDRNIAAQDQGAGGEAGDTGGVQQGGRVEAPQDKIGLATGVAPTTFITTPQPSKVAALINGMPSFIRTPLQAIFDTFGNLAPRAVATLGMGNQLLDAAVRFGIPAARKYARLTRERGALVERRQEAFVRWAEEHGRLPAEYRGVGRNEEGVLTANGMIEQMTRQQKWAFQPTYFRGEDAGTVVPVDPALKAEFDALPKEVQAVVEQAFRLNYELVMDMKEAVLDATRTEYDALIANAQTDKERDKLTKEKQASLDQYRTMLTLRTDTPYAPLSRMGKWVIIGKSDAYIAAQNAKDDTEMQKLQSDPDHYFVDYADTRAEAMQVKREILNSYGGKDVNVQIAEESEAESDFYGGRDMMYAFQRLNNMITKGIEGTVTARELRKHVTQLQLYAMATSSVRKAELKRRNVASGSLDMVKAILSRGRAGSHFIGAVYKNREIVDSIAAMREEVRVNDGKREERQSLYNGILARHVDGMAPRVQNSLADGMTSFTSLWMLGLAPSYYLQQGLQNLMLAVPQMAKAYGYSDTMNEMSEGYKQVMKAWSDTGVTGQLNIDLVDEKYRPLAHFLAESGELDVGINKEMGTLAADSGGAITTAVRKVTDTIRALTRKIEAINRLSAGIAMYELETKAAKKGKVLDRAYDDQAYSSYLNDFTKAHPDMKPMTEMQFAAANNSLRLITAAHGNYGMENTPLFLRGPWGQVLGQFQKFRIILAGLYAREIYNSFKGLTKEERLIARRAVAFMTGHAAIAGGLLGTPVAAVMMFLYELFAGEEYEREDAERDLREAIGNDVIANLLIRGAPTLMGVDVSGTLGQGNLLAVAPYTDLPVDRESYAKYILALTGPSIGGLGANLFDGVNLINDGNYYKGLERLMPRGIMAASRSIRETTQGATTRAGDLTVQPIDIGLVETMWGTIGLQPIQKVNRQYANNQMFKDEQFYRDRTSELKRAYIDAYKDRDLVEMSKLKDDWRTLQTVKREKGIKPQPILNLINAPREQAKREQKTVAGIPYTTSTKEQAVRLSELVTR